MESTAVRASKLLRELEAEAFKYVTHLIENGIDAKNAIKFGGFAFSNSMHRIAGKGEWYIVMQVNGEDIKLKGEFSTVDSFNNEELTNKIVKSVMAAIHNELANHIVPILKPTTNV